MKWKLIARFLVAAVCTSLFFACRDREGNADKLPETVSYNFHIRPILSDKCFKCHGPDANKREANFRLDIASFAFAPLTETKGAFALVPGKPELSEMFNRISSDDSSYMMPPPDSHLGVLTDHEKKLIKKWIEQGAKYETHWAFIPPIKAKLPVVDDGDWVKNEIDNFTLHKMEDAGLQPNEEASKEAILKRLSYDLTGLPPTVEMTDAFVADNSNTAYDKTVDKLLASLQYGERMALDWLDLGRYADSYGYQDDNIRTQWPWRDWVINAFNQNMPYDQFVSWQLAGDMLPNARKDQILATAFLRNHKYTEEGGVVPEEYRIEYLLDKTKTYSKGILGLTVECAQCHDHKYDPITQKDYYSLLAFFNNTKEEGFEGDVNASKPAKNPVMKISDADVKNILHFINKKDTGEMMVSVMGERDTLRKTFLLTRGQYNQPADEVQATALPAVMKFDTSRFPRNRLGLAAWTFNKQNPLTARVFVNRMWQEIFGRGIVKTSGDFGMQGELPTHPELLDWLAADFMEHGWNIKRLVRQIVMSATYRQSARLSAEKIKRDPENILLSRGPRNRLPAEFARDMVMASSGLLNKTIGGPSVKPYQPKGLWEAATSGRGVLATYVMDSGQSLYRRGIYTFVKLTVPPPSMILFDASNRDQCEVKRGKTNTPLQALLMMNDPTVLEASRVLAQKMMLKKQSDEQTINEIFRRIICRAPSGKETQVLKQYLVEQKMAFRNKKLDAKATLAYGAYPIDPSLNQDDLAAWMKTVDLVYNMEEAIMK